MICIPLRHGGSTKREIRQIFLKTRFVHKNFQSNCSEQTKFSRLKPKRNQNFIFHRRIVIGMSYMGFEARKVRQSNTSLHKKSAVPRNFGTIYLAKFFVLEKFRPFLKTMLPFQLHNNQTDPTFAFEDNERPSWLGNAVGNGECQTCFQKKLKNSVFLTKTGPKKLWKEISEQTAQFIGAALNKFKALGFPSFL